MRTGSARDAGQREANSVVTETVMKSVGMIRSLLALFGTLVLCGYAAFAAADNPLSGIYQGHIGTTPATLTLRVTNSVVAGRITRSGATDIELNGTMSEGKIVGAASIGRATSFFEAYRKLGALIVILEETGAVTGQTAEVRAEFFPANQADDGTDQNGAAAEQLDQALVDTWKTRTYEREGDMVLPVDSIMVLAPDGAYSYKAEPIAASRQGHWRSRDGRLEYRAKDANTWSTLGVYQVRGDKLIVIVPEHDPQIWSRARD
jgi:hypothetical protein